MMPNQITLSLQNTSPKLQPSFPTDSRHDIIITLNSSTQFKLRKAYLKCWSKYFERQLKPAIDTLDITQQFNFTKAMSIFYGHTPKVAMNQLIQYYTIVSFLQVKEVITNIRDHIMAFHDNFDHFNILKESIKWKDGQLKEFILSTFLTNNFLEVIKRKQSLMHLELEVFKAIVQCVSANINSNTQINWKTLNNLIKEYTHTRGDQELYVDLRQQFIIQSKLTAQQYSTIFSATESKLPPISKKGASKIQLSQLIQNKSVFFGNQLSNDFNKMMEKYNKNNQRFNKMQQRIKKLEQKDETMSDLFGITSVHITQLKSQFRRLNSVPVPQNKMNQSQSKPFIQQASLLIQQSPANKTAHNTELDRSSFGIGSHITSQQPLTFSIKSESIRQDQISDLQKILGFDNINRGFLQLIFRADSNNSKQEFLKAIDGKQELVFLIYVFQDNKNIGVYTSTKINTKLSYNEDSQAFIFSVNNGMKFRTRDPSKSIKFDPQHFICFSDDIQLHNNILQEMSVCKWPATYEAHKQSTNKAEWLVGNELFHVNEFEVYEIIRIEIKMDMDL